MKSITYQKVHEYLLFFCCQPAGGTKNTGCVCFGKSSSCSGQGQDKGDRLGSAWLFWALFGSLSFFGSLGPILAYFGLFYFFGFLWLFLALSGSFWLFFDTLQLFAAFSIGTVHCLPPGRIVLWIRSWQQESEVRLCKYEGPRENQCHNCWPRQIGSVQEDLREGLEYWE